MKLRVWLYCPDRHMLYDGTTPDRTGVGGGVTARIRVAGALARRGHEVTMACNCASAMRHAGVSYLPLDSVARIDADVLVMHSSGGGLDLSPILGIDVCARWRILFLSGPQPPKGSTSLPLDAVYAPSNFVRDAVAASFPRVFVTYHGVVRRAAQPYRETRANPYRLLYASHPSKGLDAAVEVWKLLRREHPEAELHICGGNRLWGGSDAPPEPVDGLFYHGLIGQEEMTEQYALASFGLHLQNRLEPFGLSLVESMAMGCIPVASPVGAYPELVRNRAEGFLIPGDCESGAAHRAAAGVIANTDANLAMAIRRRAAAAPLSWDTVAETWEAHWSMLSGQTAPPPAREKCERCGSACALFPDGRRCLHCGSFFRATSGTGS